MTPFYARWWRYWTNPPPIRGQIWVVDGLGRRTVQHAHLSFGDCPYCRSKNAHVHLSPKGQTVIPLGVFRSNATPFAPKTVWDAEIPGGSDD